MNACPHCHGSISIPPGMEGQSLNCPHCSQAFTAPVIAVQAPARHEPRRKQSSNQSLVVILLMVNVALSLLTFGHAAMNEYRIYKLREAMVEGLKEWGEQMEANRKRIEERYGE